MSEAREVNIGTRKYTRVVCLDEPGAGGACHEYKVLGTENQLPFCVIQFQDGPIKDYGVNGCHNEDLIAIVIDRLQHFQGGEWRCRENAIAITKLEETLMWLNKRTQDQINRGVEGTNQK